MARKFTIETDDIVTGELDGQFIRSFWMRVDGDSHGGDEYSCDEINMQGSSKFSLFRISMGRIERFESFSAMIQFAFNHSHEHDPLEAGNEQC